MFSLEQSRLVNLGSSFLSLASAFVSFWGLNVLTALSVPMLLGSVRVRGRRLARISCQSRRERTLGVEPHGRSRVSRSYPAPLSSWGGCQRDLTRSSARYGSVCSWLTAVCRYRHPIRSARAWREDPAGSVWVPGVGGCPAGCKIGCPQVRQIVSVREDGGAELPP